MSLWKYALLICFFPQNMLLGISVSTFQLVDYWLTQTLKKQKNLKDDICKLDIQIDFLTVDATYINLRCNLYKSKLTHVTIPNMFSAHRHWGFGAPFRFDASENITNAQSREVIRCPKNYIRWIWNCAKCKIHDYVIVLTLCRHISIQQYIIFCVHYKQVRYFRIFTYVIEIYPLVYDACTHCNKGAHTYVFALNVPYCTCGATHSTQTRSVYFWLSIIVYFDMLLQLDICITVTELFSTNYK